ncbi:MAG: hypothetical protein HY909_19905 [Deltaproteobacteria bacterium]|nr:hypothetical protein [Deltaproteobacteria bacterium]
MEEAVRDHHCKRCDRWLTRGELKVVALGLEEGLLCPACGGFTRHHPSEARRELAPMVMEAWRYPVSTDGAIALVALAAGLWVVSYIPLAGSVLGLGILSGYLFAVVRHTMKGHDGLPPPGDFLGFTDLLVPALRFVLVVVLPAVPALAVRALAGEDRSAGVQLLEFVLALAAVAWVPAGVAVASQGEGVLDGLNPLQALSLIVRLKKDYGLVVAVLAGIGCAGMLVYLLSRASVALAPLRVPVVPEVLSMALGLWAPVVMARIVGIMLRERKVELGLE